MATRLNSVIRGKIIDAAVEKSDVPALKAAYKRSVAKWVDDVWMAAIGGKKGLDYICRIQEIEAEAKKKMPKDLMSGYSVLRRDYDIRLNVGGYSVRAYFIGALEAEAGYSEKQNYRVTPSEFTIIGGSTLHSRFLELENRKQAYENREAELRSNVAAAVHSVGSIDKLVELWPECAELIPADVAPVSKGLSILPADLNAMIGLPTDKKKGRRS